MTCKQLIAMYAAVAVGLKAAHPATIYANANTGNDSWSGLCRESDGGACGPKRTVTAAVGAASDGDTVVLIGTFGDGNNFPAINGGSRLLNIHGESAVLIRHDVILQQGSIESIRFEAGSTLGVGGTGNAVVAHCVFQGSTLAAGATSDGTSVLVDQCEVAGPNNGSNFDVLAIQGHVVLRQSSVHGLVNFSESANRPAVGLESGAVVEDCAFFDNAWGAQVVRATDCIARRCAFSDNRSRTLSPIELRSSHVEDCDFQRNSSEAVYNLGTTNPTAGACYAVASTVDRCLFRGNVGTLGGALEPTTGTIVTSSVFWENFAFQYGGAVYLTGQISSPTKLLNCTFFVNEAGGRGGAIRATGSPASIVLDSLIVLANRDFLGQAANSQLDLCCGGIPVNYSLVEGWTAGMSGIGTFAGNPGFANAANGDFRLSANSPCIDTGNPYQQASGQLDFGGAPRVMGGRVDIGAFEFTAPAFVYGDANCDGVRDNFDIDSFVLAVLNKVAWNQQHPGCLPDRLDASADGLFNNFDIDPFIDLLLGHAP